MTVDVVGIKKVDYVKQDGTAVKGSSLFAFKDGSSNVRGKEWLGNYDRKTHAFKPLYVPSTKLDPDKAKCGSYEIEFNIYGGIENIAYLG